ncbi:NAD(P)-binding protein [Viridothelium virens]|uniref:NAD(P)-binding protein n=1 Tax=Viridothelium virens TaxID=1048519 RepID=A0A6A6H9E1_VIRVR|nr:NAD(P)-binding protein [Viridothelium virens]
MPGPYSPNTPITTILTDLAPHIHHKTILTTGVSPGSLDYQFVAALTTCSSPPARLILAGRNPARLNAAASALSSSSSSFASSPSPSSISASTSAIGIRPLVLDLSSQASIRAAAKTVMRDWTDVAAIDVLVNSAAVMGIPYARSGEEGWGKLTGATNHVLAARDPRVGMVSHGHRLERIRFGDWGFGDGETYDKWRAYGQSKTANILTAVSLAEKLGGKGLVAVSLHLGVIATNIESHIDWNIESKAIETIDKENGNTVPWEPFHYVEPAIGIATYAHAAFDPTLKGCNGAYVLDARVADPSKDAVQQYATDKEEAERLWELTEKLVGQEFRW